MSSLMLRRRLRKTRVTKYRTKCGEVLWAARSASGAEATTASSVPQAAIWTVSTAGSARSFKKERSGGNMRTKKSSMFGAPCTRVAGLSLMRAALAHRTKRSSTAKAMRNAILRWRHALSRASALSTAVARALAKVRALVLRVDALDHFGRELVGTAVEDQLSPRKPDDALGIFAREIDPMQVAYDADAQPLRNLLEI